jgi:hypothetical protein
MRGRIAIVVPLSAGVASLWDALAAGALIIYGMIVLWLQLCDRFLETRQD